MEQETVFEMLTVDGKAIPLTGVRVDAVVKDTSIETVIRQQYCNQEDQSIEAVYTFPLPIGATLLSLNVDLNGQQHVGVVVESKQAEEQYENAITEGDTAMRLQQVDDSLFTLNLGNLLENDIATIEIRYAQLLHWQDDRLRLMIPTTLGPRYGNSGDLGMQPHQEPSTSLAVEHLMELMVSIEGELANSTVNCPSHKVSIQAEESKLIVRPADKKFPMDRDFVLLIQCPEQQHSTAYFDKDADERWIAWMSVNPKVDYTLGPRQVKIVVDCSGSMGGVSIQQAKIALREIVNQLRPEDSFTVINFGSSWRALFNCLKPATDSNKSKAYQWIKRTDADLGGTKIEAALNAAYRIVGENKECDSKAEVLLITDGQTYDVMDVCENAAQSSHRHFTVGVGSAVAEDLVSGLAEKTGGACELVSPNEDMALSIVRHFKRMYLPPGTWSEVVWPNTPIESASNEVKHAFSGDTLHLFATFDHRPEGSAAIKLAFGNTTWSNTFKLEQYKQRDYEEKVSLSELTLARLAAAKRMALSEESEEKIEIGLKYQLQSSLTNYLVVVERDIKDESEFGPELRKIPGMLPAGWGGTSSLDIVDMDCNEGGADYSTLDRPAFKRRAPICVSGSESYQDMPKFLRREQDSGPDDFADNLKTHCGRLFVQSFKLIPIKIDELVDIGMSHEIMDVLYVLVGNGYKEEDAVIAFLFLFSQSEKGKVLLPRAVIRAIRKVFKKHGATLVLCKEITKEVSSLSGGQEWLPKSMVEDPHLMS